MPLLVTSEMNPSIFPNFVILKGCLVKPFLFPESQTFQEDFHVKSCVFCGFVLEPSVCHCVVRTKCLQMKRCGFKFNKRNQRVEYENYNLFIVLYQWFLGGKRREMAFYVSARECVFSFLVSVFRICVQDFVPFVIISGISYPLISHAYLGGIGFILHNRGHGNDMIRVSKRNNIRCTEIFPLRYSFNLNRIEIAFISEETGKLREKHCYYSFFFVLLFSFLASCSSRGMLWQLHARSTVNTKNRKLSFSLGFSTNDTGQKRPF